MRRCDRGADGRCADLPGVASLAVLHVRKVVAEGRYARVGHPLRDGLEGGVPHVRAGPVAEDKQMARVAGPDQQGGDLSLFRRGKEFHLSCLVGHFEVSVRRENLFPRFVIFVRYITRWRSSSRWTLRIRVTPVVSAGSV